MQDTQCEATVEPQAERELKRLVERTVSTCSQPGTLSWRTGRDDALTTKLGLNPIGHGSCYAVVVGVPPELPDVVVKVCVKGDAFIHYACACADGRLVGPHFLRVYSATMIETDNDAGGAWVFVMERLPTEGTYDDACVVNDRRHPGLFAALNSIAAVMNAEGGSDWGFDLHTGNVMRRADGTIVLLDPVS